MQNLKWTLAAVLAMGVLHVGEKTTVRKSLTVATCWKKSCAGLMPCRPLMTDRKTKSWVMTTKVYRADDH